VIGIELDVLKSAKRVVGVAGGQRKEAAIRGALCGGWINVLITDKQSAEQLLKDGESRDGSNKSIPANATRTSNNRQTKNPRK
jgi:hypothetical protein